MPQHSDDVVRELEALRAENERLRSLDAAHFGADHALRKNQTLVEGIISTAMDAIITIDESYHITLFNAAAETMFGYSAREVLGASVDRFIPAAFRESHREQVRQFGASREYATTVKPMRRIMGRRAGGGTFPIESSVSVIDIDGERFYTAVLRDVSDSVRSEALLERDALMLANVRDAVITTDLVGRITYWNEGAERLLGWKSAEILGFDLASRYDEPERTLVARAIQSALNGAQWSGEWQSRHKDGSQVWVEARLQLVSNGDSAPLGILLLAHDISERKRVAEERARLEVQIHHAQKLESLGVLAGGIAHDFNNLLVGILGNASLAMVELSPESPIRGVLHQIETSALRAAELTNQMLAYSGHGRFVVQAISLSRLIEDMSPVLESIVGEHVAISYRLAPDLPPTHADATQLRQVIVNLVSNASDAIGAKDGLVSISTGAVQLDRRYLNDTFLDDDLPEGLYVYVEVSDTGVGMDLQTKKRIFDPFFSTKFAGRGLGLAAVLGIVRGHQGALKVYSEPGKGSTFKVLLPYADAPVESAPPQLFGVGAWRGSGVVLVVDDEEAVRTVARRILERFGFEVITAADGQEGVDVFQQHADRIVAVLLDVTMPVMDGEQAYREMRLIRPDVRVVLSSGFSEQDATTRFAGKGLAGFIQKPYRATALVELLQSILESAPETQE